MGGSQDTYAGSSPVNVATPTENSLSLPELGAGIDCGDELIAIVGMGESFQAVLVVPLASATDSVASQDAASPEMSLHPLTCGT